MITKEELVKDITITNCKTFRGHDGDCFQCDVKFKGKTFAEMHEDSWSGEYVYHAKNKEVFEKVQNAFKSFPKIKFRNSELDDSLDYVVEELFRKHQIKKAEKKGFIIKTDWGWQLEAYSVGLPTILKKYKNGLEVLQKDYDELKEKGEVVLNADYLQSLGVKL
jgi:hypothetical protein